MSEPPSPLVDCPSWKCPNLCPSVCEWPITLYVLDGKGESPYIGLWVGNERTPLGIQYIMHVGKLAFCHWALETTCGARCTYHAIL